MGKRQLLFVTYRDENLEEGVSYAIELAKAMYEDITLLLVQKKSNLMDKIGNLMTAVSFAEADEHEAAREIMAGGRAEAEGNYEKVIAGLVEKCRREGLQVSIQNTELDAVSGIRTFLKNHAGVDKVVLSPAVTGSDNV
jgi:L-lactate utilization protein LutB